MKKGFYAALCAVMMLCTSCHDSIWDAINALDVRVTKLEELCKEMNTNISSLKTIVNVMQSNDYITGITEIKKGNEVIGYTITFGKHAPITIYNGEDGKNGADGLNGKDGTDGKDGHTPIITVAQDEDGVYYWKMDGKWLTDEQGNKMRVTGENGKDGENGQDGVTPQLKIENDYWYISYDNGVTCTQLGKATGEKGDSMFKSVTYDANYVYLTLMDNTVISIPINQGEVKIIDGAIMAEFSVSPTKKVYFSQGNLQYNAALGTHLCADGTTKPGTWRFAEHQWDHVGFGIHPEEQVTHNGEICLNSNISSTYNGWIDLFGWGTSGWNEGSHQPWYTGTNDLYYYPNNDLIGEYAYADWGVYNAISNGGNTPNQWRTLTGQEWNYVLHRGRISYLFVNKQYPYAGIMLFPDNFQMPSSLWYILAGYDDTKRAVSLDIEEIKLLLNNGAILLPYSQSRNGTTASQQCLYASSTNSITYSNNNCMALFFTNTAYYTVDMDSQYSSKHKGMCVRLVKDVK